MGKKVLIVDDSKTIRLQVRAILQKESIEVVEACDGAEGLTSLAKTPGISLIFADINMPIMDGLTMVERIKEDKAFAHINIVMLTTEGSQEMIQRGKAAGIKGWLVKPCNPEQIAMIAKKFVA